MSETDERAKHCREAVIKIVEEYDKRKWVKKDTNGNKWIDTLALPKEIAQTIHDLDQESGENSGTLYLQSEILKERGIYVKNFTIAETKGESTTVEEFLNPFLNYSPKGMYQGVNYDVLIDDIQKKNIFKTLTDTEQILYYDSGVYRYNGEGIIKKDVEKRIGEKGTEHVKKEVIGHIRDRTRVDREEFNKDKNLIPLKNGLFDLDTWKLQPHNPDLLFTYQLPVEYDPNAECPKIHKFFSEVLNEEDIPLIQEIFGYCLYPSMPAQKIFFLLGPGGNGKGIVLGLILRLLGMENVSNVELYELEHGRFVLYVFYGKLANLMSEPNPKRMSKSTRIKSLTGGDMISAEIKGKQRRINFINFAKMIVAANKIPEITDTTIALWRRVIAIEFSHFFGDDIADKNLIEKLTTPKELSGLLNWALEGLKRLRENNWCFSTTKSSEETKDKMRMYADPIYAFIKEKCVEGVNESVSKEGLYNVYKDFCEEKDFIPVKPNTFAASLKQHAKVKADRKRINGKRVRVWQGISLQSQSVPSDPKVPNITYPLKHVYEDHDTIVSIKENLGQTGQLGQKDKIQDLLKIIAENDLSDGADIKTIKEHAAEKGMSSEWVDGNLKELSERGDIYQLENGKYRALTLLEDHTKEKSTAEGSS